MTEEEQQSFAFEAPPKRGKTRRNDNSLKGSPARKDAIKVDSGSCERRFMRRREVQAITGWSRSTLFRQIAAKAFPSPVKLSSNTVGFIAAEVFAWMEDRIARRENAKTVDEPS